MKARRITPGAILTGPGLAEPVEVFAASPAGSDLRVAALGLTTGERYVGLWAPDQLTALSPHDASADVPLESGRLTRTSLPMPANQTHNFWYLHNTSDVVLIFVHGIFSNGRTCWLNERDGRTVYWPDLVRVDPRIETPSIYIAGYYTALEAGAFPLDQCARQLLEALERPDLFGGPRVIDKKNLVFVCHSTGGIVVRYLLCRYAQALAGKGVGLALIASPSRGSVWANIASIAARYYNQQLGQQLRWGGEDIEEIHSRFKDLVNARHTDMPGLFGMEACETRMVFRTRIPPFLRVFLPPRLKVVTTESAGQYFGQVKYLPETDHFSTVKPDALTHPSHEFLETFLRRFRAFLDERPGGEDEEAEAPAAARAPSGAEPIARGSEYFAAQRQIIEHHLGRLVPRPDVESAIEKFVAGNRRGYFIVTGSPGLGKTGLASQLTAKLDLLHHFVRRQDPRGEPRLILASLLRQVADRTRSSPDFTADLPRLTEAFESGLAVLARESAPVLVVVDALDELDDELSADLPFLPTDSLPDGVFMIVTCRPGQRLDLLQERLTDIPWRLQQLSPLSPEDVDRLLTLRGKALGAADLARVRAASAGNPLYLHALIDEIEHDPAFSFAELPAAIEGYFRRAIRRLPDPDTVASVLGILAAARKALSVRELAAIAGLDTRRVRDAVILPMRAFLSDSAEGYTVYHQSFRDFIRKEVLDGAGLKAAHTAIAASLLAPDWRDVEYRWKNLAYHLFEAGDPARFHAAIDDRFLHEKVRRFGFAVLEDVELMTRLMIEAGDPQLVERGVSIVESLRRVAGGDLMGDVERGVQFAQVVPRPDSVGAWYTAITPDIDLYVGMIPRIGVSADFVEVVDADAALWAAIGDVPASGLRSAFVARFAANLFKRLVLAAPSAAGAELLAQVGRTMRPFGNVARMSMQCAEVDVAAGVVRLASAGHPFPVLYSSRRRRCDRLPIRGRLLDGEESDQALYESRTVEIAPGDILVLVSDGLTEASRLEDPFGYRFTSTVETLASQSARVIGERILADWRAHPRDPEWRDDVTVVVATVRRTGSSAHAH